MSELRETNPINPLLEKTRIPGETFTLPSMGLFYDDGELSDETENGEVYLYPMTTLDEIYMKSPDKLFSGDAINTVLKKCSPNILDPMNLLSADVDFLLTALRKISFGDETRISYKHNCENAKEHEYTITMSHFIKTSSRFDPTKIEREYNRTLSNGQKIKLSPPRFGPTLKIYQSALADETDAIKPEKLEKDVLGSIAALLESVDEIDNKDMIMEWLTALPRNYIKELSDFITGMSSWGANFKTTIKCLDCGEEVDVSSEINPINFFFLP